MKPIYRINVLATSRLPMRLFHSYIERERETCKAPSRLCSVKCLRREREERMRATKFVLRMLSVVATISQTT